MNTTPQNTTVHEMGFEALDSVAMDALCLFVAQDERPLKGLAGYVDWRMCGVLSRVLRGGFFSGALDDCLLLPSDGRIAMGRIFAIGYGKSLHAHTPAELGKALSFAAGILTRAQVQGVALEVPGAPALDDATRASAVLSQFAPAFGGQKLAVLAEKGFSRALFSTPHAKAVP